ncbi:hypothetical protein DFJ74DRAFT_712500 [Hyaloraphidium curvatum]|nr:hypothetical protein DFJ74DRAFT_712500 [Hyaloraphidium curvatum]
MSAAAGQQFLLVCKDFTDADAISRRMAARPAHVERAAAMGKDGTFIMGGAILSETEEHDGQPKMVGSMLLVKMADRAAVEEYVRTDPYRTGKVWETVDIQPFRVAEAAGINVKNL